MNFNHCKGKVNLYGDYSFSRIHLGQSFFNYRKTDFEGKVFESYTNNKRNPVQRNHNARLGLDYQMNKKTFAGVLFTSYNNRWAMDSKNDVSIFSDQQLDTVIKVKNDEINRWRHFMANVNMQHTFNKGEVLSIDLDYLYYHADNPNNYRNFYYSKTQNLLSEEKIRISKITPIKIRVGKADYTKNISEKINIETGIKFSSSRIDNDVRIESLLQNNWVPDEALSANYHLKEDIAAAYTSFNITVNERTNVKTGLRYEYTSTNLSTVKEKNIVDRQYGNLFPR